MAPVPLTTLWGLLGKGNLFILSRRLLTPQHTLSHTHTLNLVFFVSYKSHLSGLWLLSQRVS